jgi:hypothetical protein
MNTDANASADPADPQTCLRGTVASPSLIFQANKIEKVLEKILIKHKILMLVNKGVLILL